jgi:multicomponent Na+:H+ antiporter subunit D
LSIPPSYPSWIGVGLALLIAAYDLSRQHLPVLLTHASGAAFRPLYTALDAWHSGLVGDYVTWIVVGLALMALCIAFASPG